MTLTLDVGCGSRPRGDVNIDSLVDGDDPHVIDIHSIPNFIVASAKFLPFRDKVFSKSFCFHVLEHIEEDKELFEEINRVTNGEHEIRVPFGLWEDLVNTLLFWSGLKRWRKKHHLRRYTKKMLMDSLKVFEHKKIKISYGFADLIQALKFAVYLTIKAHPHFKRVNRKSRLPFPFPWEIVAEIS